MNMSLFNFTGERKENWRKEQSTKTVFILSLSKDLNFKLRQFIFPVVLLS
jgi:hypothetical protein